MNDKPQKTYDLTINVVDNQKNQFSESLESISAISIMSCIEQKNKEKADCWLYKLRTNKLKDFYTLGKLFEKNKFLNK